MLRGGEDGVSIINEIKKWTYYKVHWSESKQDSLNSIVKGGLVVYKVVKVGGERGLLKEDLVWQEVGVVPDTRDLDTVLSRSGLVCRTVPD